MEQKRVPYYLGVDLSDRYAMISYFQLNMSEPDTVSTVVGSSQYQIPLVLAKRKGLGQWYYGDDAKRLAKTSEVICIDSLLRRAILGETIRLEDETFQAEDLLALFFKKLIALPQKLGNPIYCDRLVVTVDRLTKENMELFWRIAASIGFSKGQFMVIDHKESFYYFALNQKDELYARDVYLFEYEQDALYYYALTKDMRTIPKVVTIEQSARNTLTEEAKDTEFLSVLQNAFENKIISAVYLVGEGFEGNWMKQSLSYLCRGRRAFMGKNLYSKGACYAAAIGDSLENWPYIYMGENEMKFNVSIKVNNQGKWEFLNLISAGKNWFEIDGRCEVILSGTPKLDFWKQLPKSREAVVETLELNDIPTRPDKTTRLRIFARPISDDKVEIEIKDMGFGEIFRSTDKVWKYTMSI